MLLVYSIINIIHNYGTMLLNYLYDRVWRNIQILNDAGQRKLLEKQLIPLPENGTKNKFYYGYIIVAVCFLVMLIVFGSQMSFGVFFKPVLSDFGWTRAVTSGPFSLGMVIMGAFGFVSGRLSDRFGPRLVVSFGAIVLGLGYILTSRIDNVWQFYLYYGVLVAIGNGSTYVPLVSMLARWFGNRRGLMAGVAISGIGLGIAVVPTGSSWMISVFQWRTSLLIVGIVNLAALLILAQFMKYGPQALMSDNRDLPELNNASKQSGKISFRDAVKTRPFWFISIAWLVYGFFFHVGAV